MLNRKVIVICGPTAVGKTKLAIELAQAQNGEIISADSRQIYREMDIATAKPTKIEQQKIPHYLIDILWPNEHFSLALYQKMAYEKIEEIFNKGKQPLLVGGTGLYISAVIFGYKIPPVTPDLKLRKELSPKSCQALATMLEKLNNKLVKKIDLKNKTRLIRAIEVCQKNTSLNKKEKPNFSAEFIKMELPRAKLYQLIEKRIDKMLKNGVLDEVAFLAQKYGWEIPAMSTLGYKQLGQYLRGEITKSAAIELFKRDSRRYAKRQMTWFRNQL